LQPEAEIRVARGQLLVVSGWWSAVRVQRGGNAREGAAFDTVNEATEQDRYRNLVY